MEVTVLELGDQKVRIDQGELVGYEVEGHELIHQKGSPGWGSSDAEMFPIIGPVDQTGFRVKVPQGNAIQDQHGHLRQFPYDLVSAGKTEAVFQKEYAADTAIKNSKYPQKSTEEWLTWPYSFEFKKAFALTTEGLTITFTVSGPEAMPYMLGYHPAFKLHTERPTIVAGDMEITLDQVLAVGSRALEVPNIKEVTLRDQREITIKTEGFGHFMCWTEVRNMLCIEPITFYPYAVPQQDIHVGFDRLSGTGTHKVTLLPKR